MRSAPHPAFCCILIDERRCRRAVAWCREVQTVVRQDRILGKGFDQGCQLDEGEFGGAVDGDEQVEPAFLLDVGDYRGCGGSRRISP